MSEDEIAELALFCFDGDSRKAVALLELLKMSLEPECKMPNVEMNLEEETCYWERCNNCLKDVPDSIKQCKKPCKFFKPCTSQDKML